MTSKQVNLRRLMKIEREKKAATQNTSRKSPEAYDKKLPIGILKTKSSYQSSSDVKGNKDGNGSLIQLMVGYSDSDSDSVESDATNNNESTKKSDSIDKSPRPLRQKNTLGQKNKKQNLALEGRKRKRAIGFMEHKDTACKATAGKPHRLQGDSRLLQESVQHIVGQNDINVSGLSNMDVQSPIEDPGVMKEFEELLNYSAGSDEKNGMIEEVHVQAHTSDNSTTSAQNESLDQKAQPQMSKKESAAAKSISSTAAEYTDDVEQAAYEARLARLILLRTKQKPENPVDKVSTSDIKQAGELLDYVPALAFQDNYKKFDGGNKDDENLPAKGSSKNNARSGSNKKSSNSVPLSFILREKRAKVNQTCKSHCDNLEDDEYDAYWK
mmetsp:Transcript_27159/g.32102  ORF Transcript_27159/g.32102 Transcript_27159/m.32102 type:complete len:383 (+) Transcript_27159:71-1219(+)|eukprot:CAMPEP_0198273974 /NCGR_PEP_ID=MMETSP1447-20131203/58652_1 /TAXON_ID=420782 /ORGANISM="Chaetoceros dichaeta, Strain CCMP1751" /LENGTH=382 /DNA_ID=CAMNT_0043967883 /DNA_START=18 /DNA_END=1166 /DNA_ORIENTATION=+